MAAKDDSKIQSTSVMSALLKGKKGSEPVVAKKDPISPPQYRPTPDMEELLTNSLEAFLGRKFTPMD